MSDKLRICWETIEFGLILIRPTNVLFSNKCGGYACHSKFEEGIFLPFFGAESLSWSIKRELDSFEKAISDYFYEEYGGWCCESINEKDADFLDTTLEKLEIKVDRDKFNLSIEAFVYVKWNELPCVLVWGNSD